MVFQTILRLVPRGAPIVRTGKLLALCYISRVLALIGLWHVILPPSSGVSNALVLGCMVISPLRPLAKCALARQTVSVLSATMVSTKLENVRWARALTLYTFQNTMSTSASARTVHGRGSNSYPRTLARNPQSMNRPLPPL